MLVNGCYYHPDRSAVAICAWCGAGICSECSVKWGEKGEIVCVACAKKDYNDFFRQDLKEHRQEVKEKGGRFSKGKEFILPCIIGLILASGFFIWYYLDAPVLAREINKINTFGLSYYIEHTKYFYYNLIIYIGIWLILFSIPFGYIFLNDWIPSRFEISEIAMFFIKVFGGILIGWICFLCYFIRFLVKKIRRK